MIVGLLFKANLDLQSPIKSRSNGESRNPSAVGSSTRAPSSRAGYERATVSSRLSVVKCAAHVRGTRHPGHIRSRGPSRCQSPGEADGRSPSRARSSDRVPSRRGTRASRARMRILSAPRPRPPRRRGSRGGCRSRWRAFSRRWLCSRRDTASRRSRPRITTRPHPRGTSRRRRVARRRNSSERSS